jgi:hypothetical protein
MNSFPDLSPSVARFVYHEYFNSSFDSSFFSPLLPSLPLSSLRFTRFSLSISFQAVPRRFSHAFLRDQRLIYRQWREKCRIHQNQPLDDLVTSDFPAPLAFGHLAITFDPIQSQFLIGTIGRHLESQMNSTGEMEILVEFESLDGLKLLVPDVRLAALQEKQAENNQKHETQPNQESSLMLLYMKDLLLDFCDRLLTFVCSSKIPLDVSIGIHQFAWCTNKLEEINKQLNAIRIPSSSSFSSLLSSDRALISSTRFSCYSREFSSVRRLKRMRKMEKKQRKKIKEENQKEENSSESESEEESQEEETQAYTSLLEQIDPLLRLRFSKFCLIAEEIALQFDENEKALFIRSGGSAEEENSWHTNSPSLMNSSISLATSIVVRTVNSLKREKKISDQSEFDRAFHTQPIASKLIAVIAILLALEASIACLSTDQMPLSIIQPALEQLASLLEPESSDPSAESRRLFLSILSSLETIKNSLKANQKISMT